MSDIAIEIIHDNGPCMRMEVADARHIFVGPEIDPLAGSHLGLSGIELIIQNLNRLPAVSSKRLQLDVVFPNDNCIPTDTIERLVPTIRNYCQARIEQGQQKLHQVRAEMRKAMLTGGIFLAVCLTLSSAIDELTPFTPFLNRVFAESFMIAGWVAMWRPLELLLYDWWPYRHEIAGFRLIEQMPVTVTVSGE